MGSFHMMISRQAAQLDALKLFTRRMTTLPKIEDKWNYEESVSLLNALQSNAVAIQRIKDRIRRREDCMNHIETWKYLNRIGVSQDDLKKLSVIHVAGTKGKGTTSAMCESILRRHGHRTGLYTSPHLVSVTERIQIEGRQLTRDNFATHFNRVYKSLHNKQEYEGDMPGYFMFLTVLALDVFLRENVDVAVVEVGIGGEYDITNVVNNVISAGITSLSLEHTAILGNTIEQIAREKGGIMKTGCAAFTVTQPESALNVLKNIALTRNCTLNIVPEFDSYVWESGEAPKLTADIPAFQLNASLAIQLTHAWMSNHYKTAPNDTNIFTNLKEYSEKHKSNSSHAEVSNSLNENLIKEFVNRNECINTVPSKTSEGINLCVWPGRCQTLHDKLVDYYIDGAHTLESIEVCVTWFVKQKRSDAKKILIFNVTGDRNPEPMLRLLANTGFDLVMFTPNIAYRDKVCVDQVNYTSCKVNVEATCKMNLEIWNALHKDASGAQAATIMNCVEDAIDHINKLSAESTEKPQVLVTGSLHLVGAVLAVLSYS